ncbi:D-sedoheptulose-7-phosphate isomerase [Prosthecomicrobium sp. N25]|uniref:D-sedoheptulose-7-phosphate isomerase n=1 Tax=Prosthecomicrobium sp. N25 TaxID=3129254 RepID=UPI003078494B
MALFEDMLNRHLEAFATMRGLGPDLARAAGLAVEALASGGKLMICGNGGSAGDCQHFASEITGRYSTNRRPLAALALTTDSSALTLIANDFSFAEIFSRQVEALGRRGDVLVAVSTSGNSENILRALEVASRLGIASIGLLGKGGGQAAGLATVPLVVPSDANSVIQEAHVFLEHALCAHIEDGLRAVGFI